MLSGMTVSTPPTTDLKVGPPVADLADLTRLAAVAGTDQKARRTIVESEAADRSADRRADRTLRTALGKADLQAKRYADRSAIKDRKRADRIAVRDTRRARRSAWIADQMDYARRNVPAVFSTVVYSMALGVAVAGQVSAARAQGWDTIVGIGIAVFVEGMALSMALTAHELRMSGERALIPRTLTWVFAGIAAAINFYAHMHKPILAVILALSSLASITNWEVRSSAKNRAELRKLGFIPEPAERFGVRRWVRYFPSTYRAWSLDIATRVGPRAAELLALVEWRLTVRSAKKTRSVARRSARRAVRLAAVRGPAAALPALRSVVDELLALETVRTDPPTVRPATRTSGPRTSDRRTPIRSAIADRRTTDQLDGPRTTDHGPADPTDPTDPGPSRPDQTGPADHTDPSPSDRTPVRTPERTTRPTVRVSAHRSATVSTIDGPTTDRQRVLNAARGIYKDADGEIEWADVLAAAAAAGVRTEGKDRWTSKSGIGWVRDTFNSERSVA